MNSTDNQLLNDFLNHQGELPVGYFLDLKKSYTVATLMADYLHALPQDKRLPDNQIRNVLQFMFRSHPIARIAMWAALACNSLTLIAIHPHLEQNMVNEAMGQTTTWTPDFELAPGESMRLTNMWLSAMMTKEERTLWLRTNGFIE